VHVDVITVEPDDRASIKIDVVRDVLSRTAYRPFEGRLRVVLIREADTLEDAAQNSLLKSLEEPPPATMFILTTAVPGALLPTVRSRCMRLRFGRLTSAEVATVLVRDHEHPEADARAAAPLADGSIGQALALVDNDLTLMRETAMRLLQQTSGRADTQARVQAAAPLWSGSSKKERSREDLAVLLRMVASMLRDLEAINSGADQSVLANPVIADELTPMARAFSGDRARSAFAAVDRALTALERNAGTKLVSEWLAVQI
jgi:DNA polymerase-3 subunit delta'